MVTEDYGVYNTVLSVERLLITIYVAFLVEPMLVFGAKRYRDRFSTYVGKLLGLHLIVVSVAAAGILIFALLFRMSDNQLSLGLIMLSLVIPLVLLIWLLRRSFYVEFRQNISAMLGALYFFIYLGSMSLVRLWGKISTPYVLILHGLASFVVSLLMIAFIKPKLDIGSDKLPVVDVLKEHWNYGKWSIPAAFFRWLPNNIYYLAIPVLFGVEQNAVLRSIMNLVIPMTQVNEAISVLAIPYFARRFQNDPIKKHFRLVTLISAFMFVISIVYWIFLLIFHNDLAVFLYGDNYVQYSSMTVFAGLIPVLTGFTAVYGAAMRALENPRMVFLSYVFSSLTAVSIGGVALFLGEFKGAIIGTIISQFVTALTLIVSYIRLGRTWNSIS